MISPNSSQLSPLKRINCICSIGKKSVGLVLIMGRRVGVEVAVNTSFNVAGPIAQTPQQAIDTLRRSKGLDAVLMVADDGSVRAAWHGGERDSGRFRGWLAEWRRARTN